MTWPMFFLYSIQFVILFLNSRINRRSIHNNIWQFIYQLSQITIAVQQMVLNIKWTLKIALLAQANNIFFLGFFQWHCRWTFDPNNLCKFLLFFFLNRMRRCKRKKPTHAMIRTSMPLWSGIWQSAHENYNQLSADDVSNVFISLICQQVNIYLNDNLFLD